MEASEKQEKLSPEATLREAVTELDEARTGLFSDGLTEEGFTEACARYVDAQAAHDKAASAIGKSASK